MILLRLYCDNFYMFKDFCLDLTYKRSVTHSFAKNDKLFEESRINVRHNIVIMGGNASGKTTFGKLLCLIYNFLRGKDLNESSWSLKNIRYDEEKQSSFEIEFVIGESMAYLLKAKFDDEGVVEEYLYGCEIHKTYNITKLREKLGGAEPISYYKRVDSDINIGYQSYVMRSAKISDISKKIQSELGYVFSFSNFTNESTALTKNTMNIKLLDKILCAVDNSIEKVMPLKVFEEDDEEANKSKTYCIKFKNGEDFIVPDGDLGQLKNREDRLSHGTYEIISFAAILATLKKAVWSTIYIDEKLAHIHAELETYLIRRAFWLKPVDSQLFFTTHNVEVLDLNLPMNSFMFFKRDQDGFNKVIYPSEKLNKNDRKIRSYYENDFFEMLPDYSSLDEIFEEE